MLSRQIASKLRGYETPFYLYDMALLRQTLESVVYESKKYGYKVHYAIKANYDDHLLAVIREYGLGIDCASGNELRKAVEAGFDPKGIVYAGVGKRDKELKYAIEQNILAINCESIQELELVDALSAEAGKVTDIALRINPDIDPKTNHCIDTGQADSKFGISYEEVLEHAAEIRSLKNVNIIGLHLHIGSQIRELHVFENMCNKVNVIVENLEKLGCKFRFVDVGGGLGVNYDVPENEPIPNFASLFSIVHNHLRIGEGILVAKDLQVDWGIHDMDYLRMDCMTLRAQIVEVKDKPTHPVGPIMVDCFCNRPTYEDRGIRRRAIAGIGRADVGDIMMLHPRTPGMTVVGGSSDHCILDVEDCDPCPQVGDIVDFDVIYLTMLYASAREDVAVKFVD